MREKISSAGLGVRRAQHLTQRLPANMQFALFGGQQQGVRRQRVVDRRLSAQLRPLRQPVRRRSVLLAMAVQRGGDGRRLFGAQLR